MKITMKNMGLMMALIATCCALPACNNDDNDNDPTPVADVSTKIVATWQKTNQFMVTVDEAGNINKEETYAMQSSVWEFRNDGYQYIVQDGYAAKERYAYEVKGNKLTLTQDVEENPEIMTGTVTISNGTMTIDLYVYGEDNKKEYIEYIFQKTN